MSDGKKVNKGAIGILAGLGVVLGVAKVYGTDFFEWKKLNPPYANPNWLDKQGGPYVPLQKMSKQQRAYWQKYDKLESKMMMQ